MVSYFTLKRFALSLLAAGFAGAALAYFFSVPLGALIGILVFILVFIASPEIIARFEAVFPILLDSPLELYEPKEKRVRLPPERKCFLCERPDALEFCPFCEHVFCEEHAAPKKHRCGYAPKPGDYGKKVFGPCEVCGKKVNVLGGNFCPDCWGFFCTDHLPLEKHECKPIETTPVVLRRLSGGVYDTSLREYEKPLKRKRKRKTKGRH